MSYHPVWVYGFEEPEEGCHLNLGWMVGFLTATGYDPSTLEFFATQVTKRGCVVKYIHGVSIDAPILECATGMTRQVGSKDKEMVDKLHAYVSKEKTYPVPGYHLALDGDIRPSANTYCPGDSPKKKKSRVVEDTSSEEEEGDDCSDSD
jgi:hypothetical protein